MSTDPTFLVQRLGLELPVLGLYDTSDPEAFEPLVEPLDSGWACLFMFFGSWLRGKTLHLTPERHGCGGAGTYLFGVRSGSAEDLLELLVDTQGAKASRELMIGGEALAGYRSRRGHVCLGPLRPERKDELVSVTFLVDPDQLAMLLWGAQYYHPSGAEPTVWAPFASGCGLLAAALGDLDTPGAIIGATDLAMRPYVPRDVLAFTVTVPTFEELCCLDEHSFLAKGWAEELRRARQQED